MAKSRPSLPAGTLDSAVHHGFPRVSNAQGAPPRPIVIASTVHARPRPAPKDDSGVYAAHHAMQQHPLTAKDRRGAWWWTSAAPALVCVLALDRDLIETLGTGARAALRSSAKAHLAIYQASGFEGQNNRLEYLVLLDHSADRARLEALLSSRPEALLERNAGIERWLVVSIEPGAGDLAEVLRGPPYVSLVAPNRGILFCH